MIKFEQDQDDEDLSKSRKKGVDFRSKFNKEELKYRKIIVIFGIIYVGFSMLIYGEKLFKYYIGLF